MDMTKDIIDYTQKHTETAERLIASYQSPISETSDSENIVSACATALPFHADKHIIDAKISITSTTTQSEMSTQNALSKAMHAQQNEQPQQQQQQQQQQRKSQSPDLMEKSTTKKSIDNSETIVDTIRSPKSPPSDDMNLNGAEKTVSNTVVSGDITPPPRPYTTSEVVGMSSALEEDPDMRVDLPITKSRSLPTSPDHHRHSLDSASAELLTRMNAALFEFEQRRSLDTPMHMPTPFGRYQSKLMKSPTMTGNTPLTTHKPSISPIGLKSKKQLAAAAAAITNNPQQQQFCLRWNNYQTNLTNVFDELLQNESFVDVTLACEGQSIKAHKMVLSACSPYFQALFYDNPCQHPIIIMRDVRWEELKAIMEFMYKGEINVSQDQINPLLKVAEMLKIRGLAEVSSGDGGHGMVAPHPMVPEQRMTIFDDEEEPESEEDIGRSEDGCQKPKRARTIDATLGKMYSHASVLDLNLAEHGQRKRTRDGQFTDNNITRFGSCTAMPATVNRDGTSVTNIGNSNADVPTTAEGDNSNPMQQQPPVMTTSTIVLNPFASPNSNNSTNNNTSANVNPNNSQSSNNTQQSSLAPTAISRTPTPANSTPSAPPTPTSHLTNNSYRPPGGRIDSPPLPSSAVSGHKGVMSSSAVGNTASSVSSLNVHPHSAAAAAAAAALGVNPHHPHHSHHHSSHHAAAAAQQYAAQHPLHAAAHSHAAMASALGASLAAGVGANAGNGSGAGNNPNLTSSVGHHDEMEIKPEIAEMIREEERAKMIESGHPWMAGASSSSVTADSYQYQLQSMWQKCWNTNQQNLVQQLRFRERGPLKSWRPEAMAEAIFSVLKEGLSLSQAARKYDIPYPTFVLYANRVHNMLGPSLDGGTDPRPKARGRPQRILLGMWPEELIRSVIKAVVFRDYREIKEDLGHVYANGQMQAASPFGAASNAAVVAAAANGYHNAAKLAAQNAALAPSDSPSPLSTMTETLRRQILSQQQQSPISQTMNMYKSPAYLQRSEIEDQVSAASAKQHNEARRPSDNMPDLSALGLMGIPGLNVIPAQAAQRAGQMHQSGANYVRERERERERERDRERDRERERELKEVMQARQYGNQSRGSLGSVGGNNSVSGVGGGGSGGGQKMPATAAAAAAASEQAAAYAHYKNKEQAAGYTFNKRFAETLPPGIDFEAIANGLLQKSVNKSPRFEDFFSSEFFGNAESAAGTGAAYPPTRESPLMKIKLEHQPSAEVQNED